MNASSANKKRNEPASNEELFPIRVLEEITRVGASTLRAWERRYGLLKPMRTPKGHRLYSNSDAERVMNIIELANDGHSLSDIADILSAREENKLVHDPSKSMADSIATVWDDYIRRTVESVSEFSIDRIDSIYNEASSLYPLEMVTERLVEPVLELLGEKWKLDSNCGIAEEHFYTSWLKNRLSARFHHSYGQAKGARIICACLPGNNHEIGLLLFSLAALTRGYRVLYFGADLPVNQLMHIQKQSAARAIVLSTNSPIPANIRNGLAEVMRMVKTPIYLGGRVEQEDANQFQSNGGVILGSNLIIALRIFENQVQAYPFSPAGSTRGR